MFIADEPIHIMWRNTHCWDDQFSRKRTFIEGDTVIDAYIILNEEVEQYVMEREKLFTEARDYFEEKVLTACRDLAGSEDGDVFITDEKGEYDKIIFLLDPHTLDLRKQAKDFGDFLKKINETL